MTDDIRSGYATENVVPVSAEDLRAVDEVLAYAMGAPVGSHPIIGWSDEPCNRSCGHRGPHHITLQECE